MNAEQFYRSRQADWQQLTALLDKSQQMNRLSPAEVQQMGQLYRSVTSDLALAQREFPRHQVTTFLNQLVARGHATIYQGESLAVRRLKHYFLVGLPSTFRESLPFFLTAVFLVVVPAIIAGFLTNWEPDASTWLLPANVQELRPGIEDQELWTNIPVEERPYSSAFIMSNNIQVSFMAFGGGITAGLFSLYILIFNGLLLGGITGLTAHYNVGFELWTFVIGHGVIELSAIFIAGGSGLMLGWAILQPGLLKRGDALMLAGRKAVKLIIGCVPILIVAGLIEGFISPNENIPWPVKWSVGIVTGILLYSYLLFVGRGES
ncbi:MAG: stage II sporulation protein M [Ardenticatenaceae bacterium]|nr:stage II sporulation protein M [Ardenticatenaceae bacterium]